MACRTAFNTRMPTAARGRPARTARGLRCQPSAFLQPGQRHATAITTTQQHIGHESHTVGDQTGTSSSTSLPPNAFGCFRVRGPAVLENVGQCLHARLEIGAAIEIWDHAGAPTVHEAASCCSQAPAAGSSGRVAVASADEDNAAPCCLLIAQHIELKGKFFVTAPPPGLPPQAAHMLRSGKVVLSVKHLPVGTIVRLEGDGQLVHPVNVTPEDLGDRRSWATNVSVWSSVATTSLSSAGSTTTSGSGSDQEGEPAALHAQHHAQHAQHAQQHMQHRHGGFAPPAHSEGGGGGSSGRVEWE